MSRLELGTTFSRRSRSPRSRSADTPPDRSLSPHQALRGPRPAEVSYEIFDDHLAFVGRDRSPPRDHPVNNLRPPLPVLTLLGDELKAVADNAPPGDQIYVLSRGKGFHRRKGRIQLGQGEENDPHPREPGEEAPGQPPTPR